MHLSVETIARLAGVLVGAAAALLILIAAKPTRDAESALPAAAVFEVTPPGELEVDPGAPKPVLAARGIEPGDGREERTFSVRNQSGVPLAVGFSADSEVRTLDGLLRVRLTGGGTVVADTTLGGLRDGGTGQMVLPPGASTDVEIEAWIPRVVTSGYEGQRVDVSLVPEVEPAR